MTTQELTQDMAQSLTHTQELLQVPTSSTAGASTHNNLVGQVVERLEKLAE